MLVTRPGLAVTCLVAAALAAAPAVARADADPASDFLLTQDIFMPYQPRISDELRGDLLGVTRAAKRAGYPVKVAIIASPADLGGVPNLFNQPTRYAPFLGREISFNTKGTPLLVVMPVGFGTYRAGPRAARAIADIDLGSGVDDLARAAVKAVQEMAKAEGHPIRGFEPSSSGSGGSSALIFGVPIALLVIAFAILSYRRAGREDEEEPPPDAKPEAGDSPAPAASPAPLEPVADVDPREQQQDRPEEDRE